jgi:hypothetical protein
MTTLFFRSTFQVVFLHAEALSYILFQQLDIRNSDVPDSWRTPQKRAWISNPTGLPGGQKRGLMPTYQDKSGIQIPNSLPGANRESSCRLRYVQYYRLQQRPVIGIHQRDLRPVGIAVV